MTGPKITNIFQVQILTNFILMFFYSNIYCAVYPDFFDIIVFLRGKILVNTIFLFYGDTIRVISSIINNQFDYMCVYEYV